MSISSLPNVLLNHIADFLPMEKIGGDVHRLSRIFSQVWPISGDLDFSESLLSGADLAHILKQQQHPCRSLNFSDCPNIKDEDLGQLKELLHLEKLDLSGCAITNKAVEHLKDLTSLKHLHLIDCREISDRALFKALPFSVHFNPPDRPKPAEKLPLAPPKESVSKHCIIL